ncbi:hypothetical protein, partial [Pseudomonas lundensis]|uniref:hypothetical protein n=1 Tax=Pseudomonas lundensis TaxID=86185 RepID=UPI001CB6BC24
SQRLSLKEHHHNGDALLGTQVVVLGRHGNTLHEVLHLLLETAKCLKLKKLNLNSFITGIQSGMINSYRFRI